ncbi:hypothetical protein TWF281_011200 [Arthrobotrys megalospora]
MLEFPAKLRLSRMLQAFVRMRLPRHLLSATIRLFPSRPRKLIPHPQFLRHSRYITFQSARLSEQHPDTFDEDLKDIYNEENIEFYDNNIAGKPVFDPSEGLNKEYPCAEDFQPAPPSFKVSCSDFDLPRKSRGSILLRIYNASTTTSRSPVIIYFPSRGTNPISSTQEHNVISLLTHLTGGTTISVGYRISDPFPLSLHDALAAVDWVRSNFPTISLEKYCENGYDGRLMAVLGTGIGGSLAASIGATEGRESGIIATGAWLPVVDWAFDPLPGILESKLSTIPRSPSVLDAYSQSDVEAIDPEILSTYSSLADNPFLSSQTLQQIRSRYLATPEDFTDPFVSPLYRFSSTGVNIWTGLVSRIKSELLADPENPPAWIKQLPDTVFKRGPRRPIPYPPLDLIGKLTVPMMRIVSAEGDILHQQITEYVHAARSSMFPYESRTLGDIEKEEARELARSHINDPIELDIPKATGWDYGEDENPVDIEKKPRTTDCDDGDTAGNGSEERELEISDRNDIANEASREEEQKLKLIDQDNNEVTEGKEKEQKLETTGQDSVTNGSAKSGGEEERNADAAEWDAITDEITKQPKYSKSAESYIQYEVIPKAGHCLITGAGEITDGVKEVENMARWINDIFASEPQRAHHWKIQQEKLQQMLEEAKIERRRRRASKL